MRPISLHVEDETYRDLKSVAESTGRPVAELIREAMAEYLARRVGQGGSIFDLAPHEGGALLRGWTRDELFDEMLGS
ncbi:MAG TPA: ribbon-helix-helix protein, CopG family [Thermoanaerobaculia bacterium]